MRSYAALAFVFLLAGCNQTASRPAPVSAESGVSESKPVEPAKAELTVSAKFQHEGFIYGGFGKPGPQTFLVKVTGQPDAESVQTTVLKTSDDGSATFERTRDGALAAVGSDVVKIDDKGVTVISVSIGKLDKPSLELPSKLSVGSTWTSTSSIKTETESIKSSGTYKVVGDEKIKISAGEFVARKVVFTGTTDSSKGHGTAKGTYWFVKDMGAVKTEMTQTIAGQPPQSFVLELKK